LDTFKGYCLYAFGMTTCNPATERQERLARRERLAMVTKDGSAEGKQPSRKIARKKAREEQDDDRSFGGADGSRRLSIENQISIASLQLRQDEAERRAFESELCFLMQNYRNIVKEQANSVEIATQMNKAGFDATKFWRKLDKLETEIEKVKCEIEEKQKEMVDAGKKRKAESSARNAVTGLLSNLTASLTPNARKKQKLPVHPVIEEKEKEMVDLTASPTPNARKKQKLPVHPVIEKEKEMVNAGKKRKAESSALNEVTGLLSNLTARITPDARKKQESLPGQPVLDPNIPSEIYFSFRTR
jgi:hypothetical protein